jgi:hypothetical protein
VTASKHRKVLFAIAAALIIICGVFTSTAQKPGETVPAAISQTTQESMDGPAAEVRVSHLILANHLIIPAVELFDAELVEVGVVDGAMAVTADVTTAFITKKPGLPIVIALHSSNLRDGSVALGNRLWDRDAQQPLLGIGETIYADGVKYVTTGFSVMGKEELATASLFTGNDLLLVTCAQKADGSPSTANLIITAAAE